MSAIARRRFLTAAGVLLTAPLALRAQRRRPYRIGMLPDCDEPYCTWFHEAMRESGWREGREYEVVVTGLRYGGPLDEAAQRVVSARPDVIFTVGTHYVLAARRSTTTIPIVTWASGYPVEAGFAVTLSRPGLNVTGNATYAGTSIWSKLLELLRDVRPGTKRVGVLMSYVPPLHPRAETELVYRDLRLGAQQLGMTVHIVELAYAEGADEALHELASSVPEAVFVTSGSGIWPVRQKILGFALERRWPTITDVGWDPNDALQPLMSYGPSPRALIHQTAPYLVRILRDGAKAADLPIQRPAKFELSVNLRTAKALRLSVPPALLLRADQVVE